MIVIIAMKVVVAAVIVFVVVVRNKQVIVQVIKVYLAITSLKTIPPYLKLFSPHLINLKENKCSTAKESQKDTLITCENTYNEILFLPCHLSSKRGGQ